MCRQIDVGIHKYTILLPAASWRTFAVPFSSRCHVCSRQYCPSTHCRSLIVVFMLRSFHTMLTDYQLVLFAEVLLFLFLKSFSCF